MLKESKTQNNALGISGSFGSLILMTITIYWCDAKKVEELIWKSGGESISLNASGQDAVMFNPRNLPKESREKKLGTTTTAVQNAEKTQP